jgi:hypothetical protein
MFTQKMHAVQLQVLLKEEENNFTFVVQSSAMVEHYKPDERTHHWS